MTAARLLNLTVLVALVSGCPIRQDTRRQQPVVVGGPSVPPAPGPEADPFAVPVIDWAAVRESCPILVPGAEVSVEETEAGAVLGFTTRTGDVLDLRRRVFALATLYARYDADHWLVWHHADPHRRVPVEGTLPGVAGHEDDAGPIAVEALHGPMPEVHASIRDHTRGAHLVLDANDPLQAYHLREQVLLHAQYLMFGRCAALHRVSPPAAS